MPANVLSPEGARQASLNLTEGHQGKQALNDVVVAYRANRRQGRRPSRRRTT